MIHPIMRQKYLHGKEDNASYLGTVIKVSHTSVEYHTTVFFCSMDEFKTY